MQPSPGCSIWHMSLTRPAQPWQARGITCLSSTDGGRWRDHCAGLEGKSRAVMREYIHMRENTLNALNLGLDFVTGKFMEVCSQVSTGTDSVLPSEAEAAAFLVQVFWHIQIWAESVCTSLPLSALTHQKMNLACSEIHSPRYIIFVFVCNIYNTCFFSAQSRKVSSVKKFLNNHLHTKNRGDLCFILFFLKIPACESRKRLCLHSFEVS